MGAQPSASGAWAAGPPGARRNNPSRPSGCSRPGRASLAAPAGRAALSGGLPARWCTPVKCELAITGRKAPPARTALGRATSGVCEEVDRSAVFHVERTYRLHLVGGHQQLMTPKGYPRLEGIRPTTEATMATPMRHVSERLCLAVAAALFADAAWAQSEAGAQASGQAPVAAARAPTRKAAHPAQHAPMAPARAWRVAHG